MSGDERWERLVLCRGKLSPSDEALLRAALPEIIAAHQEAMWSRLRRRGLSQAEAEEIFQDTFLTLHNHVVENGFPSDLAAMLTTIVEGKIANHARVRRRVPFSLGLPSSGSERPPSAPDVDRMIDLRAIVPRMLEGLSREHLEVIDKVILGGLSHEEAAEALEIPEGTLKSRLVAAKRALAKLAERLLPQSQRGSP